MQTDFDRQIDAIMRRVVQQPIPIDWKSDNPLPGIGDRKSHFRGPGDDFFELDEYQIGDDVRTIDWVTSRKMQRLMKIVYQEVKEIKTYILFDKSSSTNFGTHRCTKRTLGAEMAASVMFSIEKTRDKVGLIAYNRNGVLDEIPARFSTTNLYPVMYSILDESAPIVGNASGDGLAKALSGLPDSRSLVFIISDFMNMSPEDWHQLANMALLHDVICIYTQDLRERELPVVPWPGCYYVLQDHEGNRRSIWNSARTRREYSDNFKRHEAAITAKLEANHCAWMVVSTEEGDAAIPKVLHLFAGHA